MTKQELLDYIKHGREIEFRYNDKMYSITYGAINDKHVISFCEFYEETTEVETPEEVADITRNGITVSEMLSAISEEDIWIY